MEENSPQGILDHIAEKMLLEFAESTCPIFRATTPLSRGQLRSKGHGKLSIHFAATQATIETVFRIIVSDDPAYQNFLLQQYEKRIERLSQTDKVSNFSWMQDF